MELTIFYPCAASLATSATLNTQSRNTMQSSYIWKREHMAVPSNRAHVATISGEINIGCRPPASDQLSTDEDIPLSQRVAGKGRGRRT